MRSLITAILSALVVGAVPATSQPSADLLVRVVDVGPGLCTIAVAPGGKVMVYDAGHWLDRRCIAAADELVPRDTIDLLVLSHNDSDHLGNAAQILGRYSVRHIIWTGNRRPGVATWESVNRAIAEEVLTEGATVRSLATHPLTPGERLSLGPATVTFLAGWHRWDAPQGLSHSELENVISIVLRLDYSGKAILYTGDTVGRRTGEAQGACRDAEARLVANHGTPGLSLRADVLIAGHHGADNAGATCFLQAVRPEWIVISAGHQYHHPRAATAARYSAVGVPDSRILRTDRGDDEGGTEWGYLRVPGCTDPRGDDDAEIRVANSGSVTVTYLRASTGC